jgi:segregation and condensation protein A
LEEGDPVLEVGAVESDVATQGERIEAEAAAPEGATEDAREAEGENEVEGLAGEIPLPAGVAPMNEEAASNPPKGEPEGEEIEAAEIEPAGIERVGAEMSGEAAAREEAVEVPEEPMTEETIELDTIEESTDEEWAEELETVEAEATVVATEGNEPADELVEEVKAVEVRAEEPDASAQSSEYGGSEAEAADLEEPGSGEEIEVKAAGAEGAVIAQTVEAEIPESQDESGDEPEATGVGLVAEAANVEAVDALAPESAETPDAEGMAEETLAAGHAEVHAPSVEEMCTSALAGAEAKAGPEVAANAEPEAGAEAGTERLAEPAQMELIAKPQVDEKAAAKLADQQRRRKEAEEESPFSVMVGQVYEGPLDLLLDLIRKQDIDIYDIPIAKITAQFLAYVNQLKASDVDVAGEFIYTASLLIHIKSKMLLPRTAEGPGETPEDPRRELVERLLEHERFKNAAQMLQQKQMMEAASWSNPGYREFMDDEGAEPEIAADTVDLVRVFREILERARNRPVLDVAEETVTVGQMIRFLGRRLMMEDRPIALRKLLSHTRSERALIAMFLALLELVRLQAVLLRQDRQFSEIFIKKHADFETVMNEGLADARDDWR